MLTDFEMIKRNITVAAEKSNRKFEDITVVAASKTVEIDRLKKLKDIGINICGENRVQEFKEKFGKFDTTWHIIGRLQSNKAKYVVGKVELIQSVDRLSLAEEINRLAKKEGITQNILVEINVANEPQKGGVSLLEEDTFLFELSKLENIKVLGLMAIMPLTENNESNRKYYLKMKEVFDSNKQKFSYSNFDFKYLSMGMSNDYEIAIECGSNMIRLGRCLFGERNYPVF